MSKPNEVQNVKAKCKFKMSKPNEVQNVKAKFEKTGFDGNQVITDIIITGLIREKEAPYYDYHF